MQNANVLRNLSKHLQKKYIDGKTQTPRGGS